MVYPFEKEVIYIVDKKALRRMLESGKYTQSDAARKLNVSRERIRQLVNKCNIVYKKPVSLNRVKRNRARQLAALKKLKRREKQFTVEEKPRLNIDLKIEYRCAYCKTYFLPTRTQLSNRLAALNGNLGTMAESRLYCSNACKNACPVFNMKGGTPNQTRHARIDQPDLRKLVLERDGYTCQQCGSIESLVCHHIIPVSFDPIESADVDNCITLCESCHELAHTGACSRVNLKCKEM